MPNGLLLFPIPHSALRNGSWATVARAVEAAKTAFYHGCWSRRTLGERARGLLKLADLLAASAAVGDYQITKHVMVSHRS